MAHDAWVYNIPCSMGHAVDLDFYSESVWETPSVSDWIFFFYSLLLAAFPSQKAKPILSLCIYFRAQVYSSQARSQVRLANHVNDCLVATCSGDGIRDSLPCTG